MLGLIPDVGQNKKILNANTKLLKVESQTNRKNVYNKLNGIHFSIISILLVILFKCFYKKVKESEK